MRLLIYGSGDFSHTVVELARACGHDPIGFIDDMNAGPGILGSLESVMQSHPSKDYGVALAIGYKNLDGRWNAWLRLRAAGYSAPLLVHPRAYVAESAQVFAGTMIMAGALVDVRASVGEAVVLWPGVCVSHDTNVESNCFLSPNATVCGFVNIGKNSFIGAGAAIADRSQVPPHSFIKMLSRYPRSVK